MAAKRNRRKNLFSGILAIFLILLLLSGTIACFFAYRSTRDEALTSLDWTWEYIDREFKGIVNNFWQVYMPFFERNSGIKDIMTQYFGSGQALSVEQYNELSYALDTIRVRDSRIVWIGIYSYERETNYALAGGQMAVSIPSKSFPYYEEISTSETGTVILPQKQITGVASNNTYFVTMGDIPAQFGRGKLLVAYSINDFVRAASLSVSLPDGVKVGVVSDGNLLFSAGSDIDYLPEENISGYADSNDGRLYVRSGMSGNNTSFVFYTVPIKSLILFSHRFTPLIMGITILFALLSLLVQYFVGQRMSTELDKIKGGLDAVADNNFKFRFDDNFKTYGLNEITSNINEMSAKLEEHIDKAYYFELKQKEAQIAELQASFNPHFLYNTLEMLRSKSFFNGDTETAEMISNLSALFRGYINAKPFVPIKEELAFTNRYFSIISARYGDQTEVRYDIQQELLKYGIVRGILQTLIENYFVHGIITDSETLGTIIITGQEVSGGNMLITVDDNGSGMTPEAVKELNSKIQSPIQKGEKNYGLKNLNHRLKLFYGHEYGLEVSLRDGGGLKVSILLKEMTIEEYESSKSAQVIDKQY